jgi:hypothetical protein
MQLPLEVCKEMVTWQVWGSQALSLVPSRRNSKFLKLSDIKGPT